MVQSGNHRESPQSFRSTGDSRQTSKRVAARIEGLSDAAYRLTAALNETGIAGSLILATAASRSLTLHCAASYSTCASWPTSVTVARETPLTLASADRTGSTQPSHVMPVMRRVTFASGGLVPEGSVPTRR